MHSVTSACWMLLLAFCCWQQAASSSSTPLEAVRSWLAGARAAAAAAPALLPARGPSDLPNQRDQQQHRSLRVLLPGPDAPMLLQSYPSLRDGAAVQQLLPRVHGFVNKSGVADMLAWSQKSQYQIARKAVFDQWRRDNDSAVPLPPGPLKCSAARHPPVPYPHCHVFVNHQYRVAYIRSPKSSSTSIIDWLGQCNYNKTRNWNATTCMHYSWEKFETPEQIAKIWQDYFFFGFIRNPWNRAYSLYKDMTATGHFSKYHGPLCYLEWNKFCQDPFAEVAKVHDRGCMRVDEAYSYWHMMDQYHCMITPGGGWAVDFLGRVEAGDKDWRTVVDEMNRRRLPGVPEVAFSSYGVANAVAAEAATAPPPPPPRPLHHRGSFGGGSGGFGGGGAGSRWHRRRRPTRRLSRFGTQQLATADAPGWLAAGGSDSAATSGAGAAGAGSQQWPGCEPDPDHPYCGRNGHCLDAVSQWFACDADKFGYLPPRGPAAAAAATAAAAAAGDIGAGAAGPAEATAPAAAASGSAGGLAPAADAAM